MTVASRLARVEAALSPTELVVRWLTEAHGYDDLGSYSAALLDADPSTFPMDRLAREAKASATERSRGRPRAEAERAVRAAIEGTAGPARDRASLGVVRCRDLLLGRVTELRAMDAARGRVEARFVDGAPALFPAGQRKWEEQRTQSEMMAVIALRLAELDGFDPPPDDAAAVEARVAQLVADHIEPARSTAYNELGDGRRAVAVATRWLRPKFTAGALVGTSSNGDTAPTR